VVRWRACDLIMRLHEEFGLKRVISFSLFGSQPLYCEGALRNALLVESIYPGWQCRFYVDQSVPQRYIQNLEASGAEIIPMPAASGLARGLFWRFLVAADPEVERFVVRDADSRLNGRERAAVEEWIGSGRSFHIMRDHRQHNARVMGGMWGGVGGRLTMMQALIDRWGEFGPKGRDQEFLRDIVYPLMGEDYLCHDSFGHFSDAAPFPAHPLCVGTLHVGQVISIHRPRIADWENAIGLARSLPPEGRRQALQGAWALMAADEEHAQLEIERGPHSPNLIRRVWAARRYLPPALSIRQQLLRNWQRQ
jgi:hypothetical protein